MKRLDYVSHHGKARWVLRVWDDGYRAWREVDPYKTREDAREALRLRREPREDLFRGGCAS